MQLQLLSIVLILHCIEYTGCQQHTSRHRQHKPLPGVCQGGCLTCSDYNGCLSCKPRFFIFLERNGMRQIGVCLLSCPSGFYGTRSPDRNICTKCGPECDSCFNKNFCMRCRAGYYLHQGKCQENCPEGLVRSDTQRECVSSCPAECETCTNSDTCTRCKSTFYLQQGQCARVCSEGFEPNDKLMECTHQVHCEVSEWSEWSPCSNSGRTCGFKWGEETRIRKVILHPSHLGQPCPHISETKECILKKRRCSGGKRKAERRGERRNRNNRRDKEGNEGRRERKREKEQERERDTGDREDSEKRNKTEHRRRRGQNTDPVSPIPTQ